MGRLEYIKKGKLVFLFSLVLLLALCLPWIVYAHTQPELGSQGAVTISYELSGAKFSLYKAADMSENGTFTLSGDFAGYQVSLENLDSEGWRAAAQTLAAYAERDKKAALASGTTDAQGKLQFQGLTAGLYLVTGEMLEKDNVSYEPASTLVSLPDLDIDDSWNYEPVISPKYEKQEQETVGCKVTKKWADSGHTDSRPASVTAQLLRDGELYAEAKLKKDNQWTYTWKDLEAGHKWTVTEKESLSSYTVKVQKSGAGFVITNTYKASKGEDTPSPGSGGSGGSTPGGSGTEVKLPQTGQLWWPVPYLALAGILMIFLGVLRRKREI